MKYHYTIGFPKKIEFKPLFGFIYSGHAREEAMRDKIEALPQNFLPRIDKVVEVETDDAGNLIKVVFRKNYNSTFDIVVVLKVQEKFVKTVWLNEKRDRHFTLDTSRYDRP